MAIRYMVRVAREHQQRDDRPDFSERSLRGRRQWHLQRHRFEGPQDQRIGMRRSVLRLEHECAIGGDHGLPRASVDGPFSSGLSCRSIMMFL